MVYGVDNSTCAYPVGEYCLDEVVPPAVMAAVSTINAKTAEVYTRVREAISEAVPESLGGVQINRMGLFDILSKIADAIAGDADAVGDTEAAEAARTLGKAATIAGQSNNPGNIADGIAEGLQGIEERIKGKFDRQAMHDGGKLTELLTWAVATGEVIKAVAAGSPAANPGAAAASIAVTPSLLDKYLEFVEPRRDPTLEKL